MSSLCMFHPPTPITKHDGIPLSRPAYRTLTDLARKFPATTIALVTQHMGRHKASQAFNIPEVMEKILLLLSFEDLFVAQTTNRAFYSTVEGSKQLQQKLFLLPQPVVIVNGRFPVVTTPLHPMPSHPRHPKFPGLYVFDTSDALLPGGFSTIGGFQPFRRRVDVWLTSLQDLPRVGARCRNMLLCHPPVHKLRISSLLWDCFINGSGTRMAGATFLVKTQAGITVGEVLDEVERLRGMGALRLRSIDETGLARSSSGFGLRKEMDEVAQLALQGWIGLN
ncbi:hypothetical protein EJ03DRAFT_347783 [Teratosphaeria nubilosa]|uniref:F-box domain-containing protein n=1 Tax=Teratosphaeria nubilosa TaxID=161662 RepID=A0A6G1LJZ2_9PEZI|nr:hypothetical protein EJ03DRAFT_347783 [Teratosphaeria nubilosa]